MYRSFCCNDSIFNLISIYICVYDKQHQYRKSDFIWSKNEVFQRQYKLGLKSEKFKKNQSSTIEMDDM